MRTSKDFLLQQCASLKDVLDETLRFKYGLEGSKDFFDECQARLTYISNELARTLDSDSQGLRVISALLAELSALISRIERSYIEEYSWPFVDELRKIAVALCTESTLTNPNTPPQLHVLSGGGLDAYCIHPEANRPSGSRMRIHTIVFPRTLKHFVLLHAILGHELGHAMWRCSKHQRALLGLFQTNLVNTGVFSSPSDTADWLYSSNAPAEVQVELASLGRRTPPVDKGNFFTSAASWQAWVEEIICDFIGLLTFGPSFIAAECNLLYALDPSGTSIGPSHPPVGCRINYLLTAANLLGHDSSSFSDGSLSATVKSYWDSLHAKRQSSSWFDVFTHKQIDATLQDLATLLKSLPPALYCSPSEEQLSFCLDQLAAVTPPVGYKVDSDRHVKLFSQDFRHTLYAGWISTYAPPTGVTFEQINRLCEHGIMQQLAVDIQLANS